MLLRFTVLKLVYVIMLCIFIALGYLLNDLLWNDFSVHLGHLLYC